MLNEEYWRDRMEQERRETAPLRDVYQAAFDAIALGFTVTAQFEINFLCYLVRVYYQHPTRGEVMAMIGEDTLTPTSKDDVERHARKMARRLRRHLAD